MNNPKDEFYRILNEIVGAERLSNEETYVINDYVSRLEATHREEQKEIQKLTAESTEWESKCYQLQNIIDELEKEIKFQRKCSLGLKNGFGVSLCDIFLNKLNELKGDNK